MVALSFFFVSALIVSGQAVVQPDSLVKPAPHRTTYSVEVGGLAASGSQTPFWLRTNQYGVVPRTSPAGLASVGAMGRLGGRGKHPRRHVAYGLEAVGIAGRRSTVLLPQAYAAINLGQFSLWGGRKKEVIGLGDSTNSSGAYTWSGNALPISKLQIGTSGFAPLGFTSNLVSVHAFYAHGWFPNSDSIQQSFLHQKALYVRIGRPASRIRLTGGLLHQAQWGGNSVHLPAVVARNGQLPQSVRDYLYVVTARQPDQRESATYTGFDGVNRFGNHVGSIDVSMEMRLGRWQAMGYHQHPFEDKSGVAFINFPDGLYGLRFARLPAANRPFQVQRVVLEYLNTMNQSGPLSSTGRQYDGRDDYFNNAQYLNGWTVDRRVIGTPFLTPRQDLRPALQNAKPNFSFYEKYTIANNRVQVMYLGLTGSFASGVTVQTRLSYSHNYGTFRTPFAQPVGQFSGVGWVTWPLRWLGGTELRTAVAVDQGQLYANTVGGWLSLRKPFSSFITN